MKRCSYSTFIILLDNWAERHSWLVQAYDIGGWYCIYYVYVLDSIIEQVIDNAWDICYCACRHECMHDVEFLVHNAHFSLQFPSYIFEYLSLANAQIFDSWVCVDVNC